MAKIVAPDVLGSAFLDNDILFSSRNNDSNFDFDDEDIPYYDRYFEEEEEEEEEEEGGEKKVVGWGEVFEAFFGACEGFFFFFLLIFFPSNLFLRSQQ